MTKYTFIVLLKDVIHRFSFRGTRKDMERVSQHFGEAGGFCCIYETYNLGAPSEF